MNLRFCSGGYAKADSSRTPFDGVAGFEGGFF